MIRAAYFLDRADELIAPPRPLTLHRIIPRCHAARPLGTSPSDSRFCEAADSFNVLYAAPEFDTALIEAVQEDLREEGGHKVLPRALSEWAWVRLVAERSRGLRILDLRNGGCLRLGAPADVVSADDHTDARSLGRAIHDGRPDIDGILFSSTLTGGDSYAVFDRAVAKLEAAATGGVPEHPETAEVLGRHRIVVAAGSGEQ